MRLLRRTPLGSDIRTGIVSIKIAASNLIASGSWLHVVQKYSFVDFTRRTYLFLRQHSAAL